jgi:hypothetical protein
MPFSRAFADHCLEQGLGYDANTGTCVQLKKPPLTGKKARTVAMAGTQLINTGGGFQLGGSFGYPVPTGGSLGFTTNGSGPVNGNGGGAPSWMCAIIGRSSCSYADIIGAGLGYLLGTGGGGSEPPSGGSGLVATEAGCPAGQIGFPPLCFDVQPGGGTTGGGVVVTQGEAVMGRYGAALQPMARTQTTLRCLPGMVLGTDSLCYNKRDLRKDERKWVPGRKPLLTGGDLNAISRAARAARRVKTTQKRLQKLGLLKKPTQGRRGSPGVITRSEAARALRK